MITKDIKPVKINFKDIRNERQKINNELVLNSILNNNIKYFNKNINKNKLNELVLEDFNNDFNKFWNKCINDIDYAKLTAKYLSKLATRQGSKDEIKQLEVCNTITELFDIKITKLNSTAYRPTKNGKILSNKEIKKLKINKDCCLKSFDASIEGIISGYIAAKVAFGNGGHQDNVFEEMDNLAEWWNKYKKDDNEFLFILIDTDLSNKINSLKNKYKSINNIKIFNHYDFQEYIISTYE